MGFFGASRLETARIWATMTHEGKAPPARCSRSRMRASRGDQILEGQYQIAQPVSSVATGSGQGRSDNPGSSMLVGGLRSGEAEVGSR